MPNVHHRLAIPGYEGPAAGRDTIRSPYSGETLAEVDLAPPEALAHALAVQEGLFRARDRWLPPHRRIDVLHKASTLVEGRAEELALQIAREGGKPLRDARVEVSRVASGLEALAHALSHLGGDEVPMGLTPSSEGRLAFTTREPIGLVAAVSAFNHPLNLIAHQAGPAVAAGCPIIVKPAPPTPLSCLAFVSILAEAGLPPGWCVALPCTNEVAERLVTSDRIAFFSFIGSARVGWYLRSKLAPGVRCALEHGGAAPVIVDESADLDVAVPAIVKGGYYHAGQVCVSVQRVYVHERLKAELCWRLAEAVERLCTGDPSDPDTEVGPLIREAEVARVHGWVEEARAAGARIAAGGRALGSQCYAPTLIVDAPESSKVMTQEIFGPVVCVSAFRDLDDAIRRANALPWAFQAAVFGQDIDRVLRAAEHLDATAVMVNDHSAFRVDWMPFGGRRQSGLGMGGMRYAIEELTSLKMVVLRRR